MSKDTYKNASTSVIVRDKIFATRKDTVSLTGSLRSQAFLSVRGRCLIIEGVADGRISQKNLPFVFGMPLYVPQ